MPLFRVGLIIVTVFWQAYLKGLFRKLQLVQNAAARVLTKTKKFEHITPILRSLHWLPVCQRIEFKVLLIVYKSLNGLGPKYISDLLLHYIPARPLRSAGTSLLNTPRVKTKHGESAFSYSASCIWNKLPEELKQAQTLNIFKTRLKTFMFCSVLWLNTSTFHIPKDFHFLHFS